MTHVKGCPWKKGFCQVLHDRDWGDKLEITGDRVVLTSGTPSDEPEVCVFIFCPMCGVKLHD